MMEDYHHYPHRGSTRVVPDFRSSTPKIKSTIATTTTTNGHKSSVGPRRSGGNITATTTPKTTHRIQPAKATVTNSNHGKSNYELHLEAQVAELQESVSRLALETEEIQHELNQARVENEQLREENKQLHQCVQEAEMVQSKTRLQLETVTQAAYTLYEKFRAFKCRYYEEQRFLGG